MNEKHYRIKRTYDGYLHVCVKYPSRQYFQPQNIIFVHGFLGEGVENHRMFIRIAENLNKEGFTCFLFDQYGCGYSDGDYKDVQLRDLKKDIEDVTVWVRRRFGGIIGFLGQSVGAALVLSMSEEMKAKFQICINPAAYFNKWLAKRYNWNIKGDEDYYYAMPKGILVSKRFIMDLINWQWIDEVAMQHSIPTLIIAATDDDINSEFTAKIVKNKLRNSVNIVPIEGANHSFIGQRELEELMMNHIIMWIRKIIR